MKYTAAIMGAGLLAAAPAFAASVTVEAAAQFGETAAGHRHTFADRGQIVVLAED